METSLKTGFAQISLAAQKIWVAQDLGGAAAPPPPAPPVRTPMNFYNRLLIQFARIPAAFVVRFIRYRNRVKVITLSIAV